MDIDNTTTSTTPPTTNVSVQTPLLPQTNVTHQHNHNHNRNRNRNHDQQNQENDQRNVGNVDVVVVIDGEYDDTQLDKTLQRLEFCLRFLGFDQSNVLRFVLSWVVFLVICVIIPVIIIEFTHCSKCENYQVRDFEYEILTSQVLLGAASLISLSYNLTKKGIRKFLFVDRYRGHTSKFMGQYIQKIKDSYTLLVMSLIPCCLLKFAHEFTRMLYVENHSWWQAGLVVSALVISWTYLSAITLAACILFHLACSLQIIHFEDYKNLLERESSILTLMEEHIRLRDYLSKISHRFRKYLLLVFLLVTASLFMTLVQITGVNGRVTFLNGGNFAVTSLVQVVETLLCLHAGTKISHRAQGIGAVACKWHALVTCKSFEGSRRSISVGSLSPNCSESDLEALETIDGITVRNHSHFASVSSHNKRQSFVMYLQTNPGGITLYGWVVDRSLLTTIFFIELSLVLFVLGQTIIFSSSPS
ncbi:uncharacterized protein LOC141598555 isoform X2 [Silene latifolia]|uniref:uncharacterized protein LOC141598555 isoform X2 n=1 Tax=Silene latifolia TaxID=37657 RepID=UPI003D781240